MSDIEHDVLGHDFSTSSAPNPHALSLSEYQKRAAVTAVYPRVSTHPIIGIMYAALGLTGEAGEVAEQVKKSWRNEMRVSDERRKKIADELGDVLWYAATLASELDLDLSAIADANLIKLAGRKLKGELRHESGQ